MVDFISSSPKSKQTANPLPLDPNSINLNVPHPETPPNSAQTSNTNTGRSLHIRENTNLKPLGDNAGYTCSMSSEEYGGSLRYDFDPDPSHVGYPMTANLSQFPTRGGQLVYSAGRVIGPLQIVGFLRSTWDLLDLGEFVQNHMTEAMRGGKPLHFIYPERDFDFSIMIQTISEIAIDSEEGELKGYTLSCMITEDHRAIKVVEMTKLGIPANVEWIDALSAATLAQERFPQLLGAQGGNVSPSSQAPTGTQTDPSKKTDPGNKDVTKGGTKKPGDTTSNTTPNLVNIPLSGRPQ